MSCLFVSLFVCAFQQNISNANILEERVWYVGQIVKPSETNLWFLIINKLEQIWSEEQGIRFGVLKTSENTEADPNSFFTRLEDCAAVVED